LAAGSLPIATSPPFPALLLPHHLRGTSPFLLLLQRKLWRSRAGSVANVIETCPGSQLLSTEWIVVSGLGGQKAGSPQGLGLVPGQDDYNDFVHLSLRLAQRMALAFMTVNCILRPGKVVWLS